MAPSYLPGAGRAVTCGTTRQVTGLIYRKEILMRAAGLFVALVGVAGIAIGLMALFGVHALQPTASTGDVRMPGAGPLIAGLILLAAGLAIATSRAKA
jgi:hypothetical protein